MSAELQDSISCSTYAGARVVINCRCRYTSALAEDDDPSGLTNDCLQVKQMMDFAASLTLD